MLWIKAKQCVLEGGRIEENVIVGIDQTKGLIFIITKFNDFNEQRKQLNKNDQLIETELLLPGFFGNHFKILKK